MFGWYVDLYSSTNRNPTSMSELKLLDTNRPILFDSGPVIESGTFDFSAWGNAYDTMKGIIGDYVNVIYCPPAGLWTAGTLSTLKEQFPSINLSFPKGWTDCLTDSLEKCTGPDTYYTFIYFKNNKKLLRSSRSSGDVGIFLDNNGTLAKQYEYTENLIFQAEMSFYSYQQMVPMFRVKFPRLNGDYNIDKWWTQPWQSIEIGWGARSNLNRGWRTVGSSRTPSSYFLTYLNLLFDNNKPDFEYDPGIPPENPYGPGGDSEPGDEPPGSFDDSSDPIPDSSLPTISAANTGFTRIYNPTLAQVQDLARYLWTDDTILETIWNKIRQYFENPMDAIIGFNLVPVAVPNGGTKNFALMYIDTGVQMTAAASQFVDQDCGSVKLERYYGSALDQAPYTKVSCFLPYIGTVQLNTDEVMGTTLQVKYRVDIVSGSCVAKILVDGNVLYQYSGHCAITIPISSSDFSSYVQAAINVAKIIGGVVSGGAAGGAISAIGAVSTTPLDQETAQVVTRSTNEQEDSNIPQHRGASGSGPSDSNSKISNTKASFSGLTPANIANTVGEIMSAKPIIEHTGSFSGNSGYLGVRRPFLIIERPNMCMPKSYQTMNGFPAMITMKLGDCKGYTRVQQVQLTGMSATNPEQAEILNLLKMGVLL